MLPGLDYDTYRALSSCASPAELAERIDLLTADLGVGTWCYAVDLPVLDEDRSHFMLGGYPGAWVEHYFAHDYLRIDPVIAHCQDHATPYLWAEALRRPRVVDPHRQAVWRLFGEAAEFGLRAGLSVPLHGPGASWGLMSFACGERNLVDLGAVAPQLTMMAHFVHDAARGFAPARALTPAPRLTRRERECLYWAAHGKTSWEIGRLLGVAERTAVFHLQNVCAKLGVSGRQAAVARAIALGLITPD